MSMILYKHKTRSQTTHDPDSLVTTLTYTNHSDPASFGKLYDQLSSDLERIKFKRLYATQLLSLHLEDSAIQILKPVTAYTLDGNTKEVSLELARSYVLLDRLAEADKPLKIHIDRLRQSINLLEQLAPENQDLSWAYLRLGIRLWYSEQYGKAEKWWRKALEHSQKYKVSEVEIKALHHIGFIYTNEMTLALSQAHYKYLLSIIESKGDTEGEDYILAINALGSALLWNEDLDSALFYYQKGLNILEKLNPDPLQKRMVLTNQALISHNIGSVYLKKEVYDEAVKYLKEAININEALFGSTSTELIRSLRNLGQAYRKTGQPKLSEEALYRSLHISKEQGFDIPKSYSRLGDYFIESGEYSQAIDYYDSAIISNGVFLAQKKDIYVHGRNLFTTFYGQSQAFAASQEVDLEKVEEFYQRFNQTLKFFYERVDSKTFFQWVPLILENLYLVYSRVHDNSPEDKGLSRLWEITELNKAVKLRKQLGNEDTLSLMIPQEFLVREKEFKDSISTLIATSHPGVFDSALFFLNTKYDEFLKELESAYPRYYALKSELKVLPFQVLKRNLSRNTTLLNFLEGKENVYILRVNKKGFYKQQVSKSKLADAIEAHNTAIIDRSVSSIQQTSFHIKRLLGLNSEDLEGISHLHIIPDGLIWNLNFGSLMNNNAANTIPLENPYTFSFHYFAGEELQKGKKRTGNVLAFSYSDSYDISQKSRSSDSTITTPSPIPGTATELRYISDLWDGQYYFAKKASESAFKSLGGQYSILHLAVHGSIDEERPERSFLQFAAADSLNDGKLHVYEIYSLDLNADLAVLSACHSGQGKIVAGEGMMSLGRAFAYAGVRSLLISRWEVSDYSAPHLMKYFYKGLKEGMFKSEALRYAQTQYLLKHSDGLTSSPFYWSSFYILGDDSPIYQPGPGISWVIWAILIIATLSGTGIYLRNRRYSTFQS
jgi:CHAT domain-containing protein/Tfp pilus assembly protein PilF